jgi:hypothetical protein
MRMRSKTSTLQSSSGKKGVFLGVVPRANEVQLLSERFYDASSEAAVFIVSKRRGRNRRP